MIAAARLLTFALLLSLTGAVLSGLALAAGARTPSMELAFVAQDGDGRADIYVADTGRRMIARLTRDGFPKEPPVWSPDGSQIAIASQEQQGLNVYLVGVADGSLYRLTDFMTSVKYPVWRPFQ